MHRRQIKKDFSHIDFSSFDLPEITFRLFYPRPEWRPSTAGENGNSHLIAVDGDAAVGARFFLAAKGNPNILFFHGNGEIVADYDEMGLMYGQRGLNFLPVDYRGYGRSTGQPSMTAMMRDAHVIFDYVRQWLTGQKFTGPLLVMGRSLGSAPALELADQYPDLFDGLIIESGFARIGPLLQLMGISMSAYGLSEEQGPRNLDKIGRFRKPTLIIHGEFDQIISVSEGQALFDASPASCKKLLRIPCAGHNDLFFVGMAAYFQAIAELVGDISSV